MKIEQLRAKAAKIKLVITDCDGVLTDTGVYYSANGEELKRFSIRDGMGVERLRKLVGVETGIMTGELSGSVKQRAAKLKIAELHLGIKDKPKRMREILDKNNYTLENIAYIGDDYNDLALLHQVGLSASPSDGMPEIRASVDYVCQEKGGNGAFRDFAELIIRLKSTNQQD